MNTEEILRIFKEPFEIEGNFITFETQSNEDNQGQTNKVFSEKWAKVDDGEDELSDIENFQKDWFLSLYGFESEDRIRAFLADKKIILDAGCGLGYKTAWLAELAPNSIVIGMDFSQAAEFASNRYRHINNCFFIRGDIANTGINENSIDFVLCDQVIMHTEDPECTFQHLAGITKPGGEFGCYVYAKKALPRELLDDYFRKATHSIPTKELWEMSEQLTELGKRLSELDVKFEAPDIPLLGIKGGEYDIQRFIYWNFVKCFYHADWGRGSCDSTNFDWYSPSNAKRFSKEEFETLISDNSLTSNYFHSEEACFSGRFGK
ncbi:methyltransferase type 11 [Roseivirga sp. 4D4]|uniref:class I SAM-dependent methyltransferase n=1 Tax=Roseivirga sp. 4D4 TaxID=1889784 RepID=UPI000852D2F8|nr:class I SAM-dependent methyltransferase [Roseivirga sp. 4D4]OEK02503.1 methyltransferase type 11 [Roseivirga sp. 4D4]